jgi:hypothetical protein
MGGEVVPFDEEDFRPADRGVAGDRGAVDPSADDKDIETVHG